MKHPLHCTRMCRHQDHPRSPCFHHLIHHHPVQIASRTNLVLVQHSWFHPPLHSDYFLLPFSLFKQLLFVRVSAFSLILLHASYFARGFCLRLQGVCRRATRWLHNAGTPRMSCYGVGYHWRVGHFYGLGLFLSCSDCLEE